MNLLNNYFRPKSTFLPLLFGIVVMLLTNTLWLEFAINPRAGVICLSLLFALIVFSDRSLTFIKALVCFMMMAFLIFIIAVGCNQLIQAFYMSKQEGKTHVIPFLGEITITKKKEQYREFFRNW